MRAYWLLAVCLGMVWPLRAETLWTETFRGIEAAEHLPAPPDTLRPWFYRLAVDLRGQWSEQLQAQLSSECDAVVAAHVGEQQGIQIGSHGVRWFDETAASHHRLLTSNMQLALTQAPERALAWRQRPQGANVQFIWQDVVAGQWRSLQLRANRLQQLDWQAQVPSSEVSWLALEPALGAWRGHQVVAVPAAHQLGVQLLDVQTGTPLLPAQTAMTSISAWPAALDSDHDGEWDRLYQVDHAGRLWRIQRDGAQLLQHTVADLTAAGWRFDGAVQAVRSRWPDAQGVWQQGDVVILTATANPFGMVVLPVADTNDHVIGWSELADAGDAQPTQGWQLVLGAKPVGGAKVMAGVLYLPLRYQTSRCEPVNSANQLLALHLFRGSAAYEQKLLTLPIAALPTWQLQRAGEQLQLQFNGQLVLPAMRQIAVDCPDCVAEINLSQLNRWRTYAVFAAEQGGY